MHTLLVVKILSVIALAVVVTIAQRKAPKPIQYAVWAFAIGFVLVIA